MGSGLHGGAPLRSTPRLTLKGSGAWEKSARGEDRAQARTETDWYAACSGETHQRWIDEGGHLSQV